MSKRDELDTVRYLIDMHLLFEKSKDKLQKQAFRLDWLAKEYKNAGFLKDAVCEIQRSLNITENGDNKVTLTEWKSELGDLGILCPHGCGYKFSQKFGDLCPGCNRLVMGCIECKTPNRLFDPYCRQCGKRLSQHSKNRINIRNLVLDWFHPTPFEFLSSPPKIIGDLVIITMVNDRTLMALKLSNGEIVWKENILPPNNGHTKLTFSYPYIYFYSAKRVDRVMLGLGTLHPQNIFNAPEPIKNYSSFPLVDENTHAIFFPVNDGLLCHDIWRKKAEFLRIFPESDDVFFPVFVGIEKFILSKKGKIYKLFSDRTEFYCSVNEYETISPPVFHTESKLLYFESYIDGKRIINSWSHINKTLVSKELSDTFCSSEDSHFHNPPILYKEGVLLLSCQEPIVYYATTIENEIDLREIRVDVSTGIRRVLNIEYLFSLVAEPYLISRTADGFFYINLEDTADNGMEFFGSEMSSKPLIFNNKIVLLCRDGIRCYTF